jgi:UDP-GlcNAc:undecaprenyl-phosphate GlcNAc-1-phosphate transferase
LAWKLDAVDYPSTRRVNTKATPRLGGLGIFIGVAAAFVFECLGEWLLHWNGLFGSSGHLNSHYPLAIGGLMVMLATATIDDIWQLRWWQKLLGQIIAAAIICASGIDFSEIANPFSDGDFISFGVFTYPITIIYIVGFVNMMNLIDGLDGLATGITIIVGAALFVIAYSKGRFEAAMLALMLVGACLAFLRYNFNPASIYMGDVGSHLIGTMLAVISLVGVMRSPTFIVMIVPIIIAGIPFLDTLLSIIRRLRHHERITMPDMEHLHHKLLRKGLSVRKAVAVTWMLTLVLAIFGVVLSTCTGFVALAVFVVLAILVALLLWRIGIFGQVWQHYYNPRKRNHRK